MTTNSLDQSKLEKLYDAVIELSRYARFKQKNIEKTFKTDGSVLTETDLYISSEISRMIRELFDNVNIISEEEESAFDSSKDFTFILDPIDGTDVYSQGFPSFATALGILNKNREPIGAIIAAPRFGIGEEELILKLFPGEECFINSTILEKKKEREEIKQIMMTSHDIFKYDFSSFNGKIRTVGSSIIHMVAPVLYSEIDAAITQSCYAWDIAASHAILLHYGLDLFYSDGSRLEYTDQMLKDRKKCKSTIYACSKEKAEKLIKTIPFMP